MMIVIGVQEGYSRKRDTLIPITTFLNTTVRKIWHRILIWDTALLISMLLLIQSTLANYISACVAKVTSHTIGCHFDNTKGGGQFFFLLL